MGPASTSGATAGVGAVCFSALIRRASASLWKSCLHSQWGIAGMAGGSSMPAAGATAAAAGMASQFQKWKVFFTQFFSSSHWRAIKAFIALLIWSHACARSSCLHSQWGIGGLTGAALAPSAVAVAISMASHFMKWNFFSAQAFSASTRRAISASIALLITSCASACSLATRFLSALSFLSAAFLSAASCACWSCLHSQWGIAGMTGATAAPSAAGATAAIAGASHFMKWNSFAAQSFSSVRRRAALASISLLIWSHASAFSTGLHSQWGIGGITGAACPAPSAVAMTASMASHFMKWNFFSAHAFSASVRRAISAAIALLIASCAFCCAFCSSSALALSANMVALSAAFCA